MTKDELLAAGKEVAREMALRRHVFPKWIESGRLTLEEAEERMRSMQTAAKAILWCLEEFEMHPNTVAVGD